MRELVFATNNLHKLAELRSMLKGAFSLLSLENIGCREDIPETADTIEGNALLKARYVREHYGVDCFADDTGLEVEALGGAPGVFTARFGAMHGFGDEHNAECNMRCLLSMLEGVENRKARFRTAIALCWQGREELFEGVVDGAITSQRRGAQGFGYDPIFCPEGFVETFAEMEANVKNSISHRARAVEKLVGFLHTLPG